MDVQGCICIFPKFKNTSFKNVCHFVSLGKGAEEEEERDGKERWKRQADQYEYTPTKTRCPLLLVADYRFYQEMGGSNTKTTINYLVTIFISMSQKLFLDCKQKNLLRPQCLADTLCTLRG